MALSSHSGYDTGFTETRNENYHEMNQTAKRHTDSRWLLSRHFARMCHTGPISTNRREKRLHSYQTHKKS